MTAPMSKQAAKQPKGVIEYPGGIWSFCQRLHGRLLKLHSKLFHGLFFARFGAGSLIRKPLFISNPHFISIGQNTHIRDGVRLEVVKLMGRIPRLEIGNRVLIEQNCQIACCNHIVIEDDVAIAARCTIVDIRHPHPSEMNGVNVGSAVLMSEETVLISRGAFLGVGVTVLPGARIGAGAVIGAHSVVTGHIPPHSLAVGSPAKPVQSSR